MSKKIIYARKIRSKNEEVSKKLRSLFDEKGIFVVNLMGSPGAGKTSLIEAMAPDLRGIAAVIEGDLQTDKDRERIEQCGLQACQINTLGACHLDAEMVHDAVEEMSLEDIKVLFIENVGNLVCPASFVIGENMKVAVISTTEGDDKPAKYPSAIRKSTALVVTKLDLLPHINCDVNRMESDARTVHPELECFRVCAQTDEGINEFLSWIMKSADEWRDSVDGTE